MSAASPHKVSSSAERTVPSTHMVERSAVGALSAQLSPCAVPDWSKRIPALDGLRGLAILMVLMRHTIFSLQTNSRLLLPILAAGQLTWSGVDLFFVLSGFLIGGILLDAKLFPPIFQNFLYSPGMSHFPALFFGNRARFVYVSVSLATGNAWRSPTGAGTLGSVFDAYPELVVVGDPPFGSDMVAMR